MLIQACVLIRRTCFVLLALGTSSYYGEYAGAPCTLSWELASVCKQENTMIYLLFVGIILHLEKYMIKLIVYVLGISSFKKYHILDEIYPFVLRD